MSDQEMMNLCRNMKAQGWAECAQYCNVVNPPQTTTDYVLKATGAATIGTLFGLAVSWGIYKCMAD